MATAVASSTGSLDRSFTGKSDRITYLAQPKTIYSLWNNTVGTNVAWGTQETIRPISRYARQTSATPRVEDLAKPKHTKQDLQLFKAYNLYSCGRTSVIWDVKRKDEIPPCSDRVEELTKPKQPPKDFRENRPAYVFSCGRSSPIWRTDESRPSSTASSTRVRTESLSQPKSLHKQFQNSRTPFMIVSRPALTANATEHVASLSSPKKREDSGYRSPYWQVSPPAKSATASNRCLALSKPKGVVDNYQAPRNVYSDVPRSTLRAKASTRLAELATPIIRASMDHVQFDPDAFFVKQTALKAKCSKRIEELSVPIQR